jgi:hypothetical protein
MFFRFGSALILVVVASLLGIFVEKQNLTLRREISRQHYRMDVLQEEHARLRLQSQQLAAVERLFATVEDEGSGLVPSKPGSISNSHHRELFETTPTDVPDSDAAHAAEPDVTGKDKSDLTTRRVPLLFWQKPVADPRLKRGSN